MTGENAISVLLMLSSLNNDGSKNQPIDVDVLLIRTVTVTPQKLFNWHFLTLS